MFHLEGSRDGAHSSFGAAHTPKIRGSGSEARMGPLGRLVTHQERHMRWDAKKLICGA